MKINEYLAAADEFREGVARICRLYGQSPLLGRLFAELYLHDHPISLDEACQHVGAAKSTVSVALRKLLAARVVRRIQARGDRRDLYEAVVDPWTIFADWARLFMQPEIEMWRTTGSALERSLEVAPPDVNRPELRARIALMREFVDVMERVLGQVGRTRQPPQPARTIPIRLDDRGEE